MKTSVSSEIFSTENKIFITHCTMPYEQKSSINQQLRMKWKAQISSLTLCFSRVRAVPWVAFERMRECEMILVEFNYYLHLVFGFYYSSGHMGPSAFSSLKRRIRMLCGCQVSNAMSDRTNIEVYFLFDFVEYRTYCGPQDTNREEKIKFQARKSIVFEEWTTRQKPINFGVFGKLLCR